MLIKPGIIVGNMSGAVGSHVVANNRGGMYVRVNRKPTNPSATPEQVVVRSILSSLAQNWQALTPLQRAAWKTYADNVPAINRLGDSRTLPALAMYIRLNSGRVQAGYDRIDTAPTIFSGTSLTPPVIQSIQPQGINGVAYIAFDESDEWNQTQGSLQIYVSTEQADTINFWKGPYRLMRTIDSSGAPTPSPQGTLMPSQTSDGNVTFFRFVATTGDGRISTSVRAKGDIGAGLTEVAITSAVITGPDIAITVPGGITSIASPSLITTDSGFSGVSVAIAGGVATVTMSGTATAGDILSIPYTAGLVMTDDLSFLPDPADIVTT